MNSEPLRARPRPGREVAVTFDDLPVISVVHGDLGTHRAITTRLLEGLTTHRVPAIGFVNERKLESQGAIEETRVDLLRRWLDAGLELGNHTYSHPDLHRTSATEFEADVIRGEPVTRALLATRGLELRYFRHPYLHTGTDLATKRHVEGILADHGYRVAPVTIYTEDYLFAAAYDRSNQRGDARAARQVADAYVPYIESQFVYYERLSQRLLGYELPQTLVLHANTINAETIEGLVAMMKRRGYAFVPLERALADPAYAVADAYIGSEGISWLQRWALNRGLGGEYLDGEPVTPRWVRMRAEVGRIDQLRRSWERRSRAAVLGLKGALKAAARASGVMPRRSRPAED
jgi:peptidoglycan/xylan/chitin deacetylase (PgdA/CDA1 family)